MLDLKKTEQNPRKEKKNENKKVVKISKKKKKKNIAITTKQIQKM